MAPSAIGAGRSVRDLRAIAPTPLGRVAPRASPRISNPRSRIIATSATGAEWRISGGPELTSRKRGSQRHAGGGVTLASIRLEGIGWRLSPHSQNRTKPPFPKASASTSRSQIRIPHPGRTCGRCGHAATGRQAATLRRFEGWIRRRTWNPTASGEASGSPLRSEMGVGPA